MACQGMMHAEEMQWSEVDPGERETVQISGDRMRIMLAEPGAHCACDGGKEVKAARSNCAGLSLVDVIEPMLFSTVFWATLGEAKWVLMLSKTSRALARREGVAAYRSGSNSHWVLPTMEKWREFALSAMIDMAALLSPPDSKVVADAIRLAPSNRTVLEGCQALLDMTPDCVGEAYQRARQEDGPEWKHMVSEYERIGETDGGITSVLTAMRRWPDSPGVQLCGCRFLRLVGRIEQNMIKIATEDGITIVLDALKRHCDNVEVQHFACWALMNLAYNSSNRVKIASNGGIQVLLASLERHATHTGVQELGCWGLSNIACSDENNEIIAESNGGAYVIRAMDLHPNNPAIQEGGINVLLRLSWGRKTEKVRDDTRQKGGVQCVKRALSTHTFSHPIQSKGYALLERIEQF